jgi:hypothetical protein
MLLDKRLTLLRGQWMDAAQGAISFQTVLEKRQKKVKRKILNTKHIK